MKYKYENNNNSSRFIVRDISTIIFEVITNNVSFGRILRSSLSSERNDKNTDNYEYVLFIFELSQVFFISLRWC